MVKKYGLVILVVVLILVALFFSLRSEISDLGEVCFSSSCVDVEVMDSFEERQRGLMFREELGENSGMLFVFSEEGRYGFWMKNTLIPLDIIWLDEDFRIVEIVSALPCESDPCGSYGGNFDAKYVVEVNEGFVLDRGIVVGEIVEVS